MPKAIAKDDSHLGAVPEDGYLIDPGTGEVLGTAPAATPTVVPILGGSPAAGATNVLQLDSFLQTAGFLGTRAQIESELDAISASVRQFHRMQPDLVMKMISAFSARLTELAVLLHRVEAYDRQYTRVRTQQVERWLTDLDRQYKIASRMVEINRQDLELLR